MKKIIDIAYNNPFKTMGGDEVIKRKNVEATVSDGGCIVKVHHNQYDYLVDGELITQRCGHSLELLELLIEHKPKAGDYNKLFEIDRMLKANSKIELFDKNGIKLEAGQNIIIGTGAYYGEEPIRLKKAKITSETSEHFMVKHDCGGGQGKITKNVSRKVKQVEVVAH